jgi:hypothetical protein
MDMIHSSEMLWAFAELLHDVITLKITLFKVTIVKTLDLKYLFGFHANKSYKIIINNQGNYFL